MRSKSSQVQVLSSGSATPAALNTAGFARIVAALMPAAMPVRPFSPFPALRAASSSLDVSMLYLERSSRAPRVEYSVMYFSSIWMMSGASLAATWVASLSQYPLQSPYSGLILMLGFSASKAAIAACVTCARLSLPHQENRSSTGPPSLLAVAPPPQALSAMTTAAAAATTAVLRKRGRAPEDDAAAESLVPAALERGKSGTGYSDLL